MAITARVKSQYFQQGQRLIRLAPNQDHSLPTRRAGTPWTPEEHDRFLEGMERYPSGPWKVIAAHIGTRTTRQTMTHAQKYREKIARRQKGKEAVREVQTTVKAETLQHSPSQEHSVSPVMKQKKQEEEKQSKFVELELDESVITLLEAFEPLEILPSLESLTPVADACYTTTIQFGHTEWLNVDSPFQKCRNGHHSTCQEVVFPVRPRTHSSRRSHTANQTSPQEHDSFLEALERYPSGPWKAIAAHIGTRTTRQTMTHAQKYREKIARRRKANAAANPTMRQRPDWQASGEFLSTISPVKKEQFSEQEGVNARSHIVEVKLDDSIITQLKKLESTVFGLEYPKGSTDSGAEWQSDTSPFQQWIVEETCVEF
ncbi:Myb-like protein J [Phytophthora citrophthora]|uniref:Myb-like protein J n=1 Tax=Phytophthora citrophthora TaxID=4793 RepID=A0AAD9GQD3_9STRA|nr:Myb-like protein J [Phytophthora citrophthora]